MKIPVNNSCATKCVRCLSLVMFLCLSMPAASADLTDKAGPIVVGDIQPIMDAREVRKINIMARKASRGARTPNTEKAAAFFQKFIAMERDFDPALMDLYDDDASVTNTRRLSNGLVKDKIINVAYMKKMYQNSLWFAKWMGDTKVYADITYTEVGNGVRIMCTRSSLHKRRSVPYELIVGPGPKGDWVILMEHSESW